MKRIILHWSAGAHTPSDLDRNHYHFIIDGAGRVHNGKWPVSANEKPVKGQYAAHTLNANTGSIGVAVAAMAGAKERPFDAGSHPITPAQVQTLVTLCRKLMAEHGIKATRETVLSHAEVQPTLDIKQRGKWDIAWIPGMDKPGDPVKVGDHIRGLINSQDKIQPTPAEAPKPAAPSSPAKPPAQRVEPVSSPDPAPKTNGPVALVVLAVLGAIAAAATGAWNWLLSWF
jgi:hypothetical protein